MIIFDPARYSDNLDVSNRPAYIPTSSFPRQYISTYNFSNDNNNSKQYITKFIIEGKIRKREMVDLIC